MTISDETVELVASSRFGSKLGWAHAGEAFKAAALEQARRELEASLPAWVASAAPDTIIGKLRDDERQAMTNPMIPAEAIEALEKLAASWDDEWNYCELGDQAAFGKSLAADELRTVIAALKGDAS